jgi:calcium permeable stress-gated cation channel
LGSTSISAIVATFIPTFLTAVLFLAIFVVIRNKYRKIYTPRTYIGVVPEKYI